MNDLVLVHVMGPPRAGKTSLARALSRMTTLPRQCNNVQAHQLCWSHRPGTLLSSARKLTFVTWDMELEASEIAQATVLPGIPAIYLVVWDLDEGLVC